MNSIQILLALASHYDYEVHQFDVKTTFLNGILHEDKCGNIRRFNTSQLAQNGLQIVEI
jgi:hypothetical protein